MADDAAGGTLSAQNTWVGPILVSDDFDFSLSGTFNGTVTVQRRRIGQSESDYKDIETFTSAAEKVGHVSGHWEVRAGFKTGEYTSGSAVIGLSQ